MNNYILAQFHSECKYSLNQTAKAEDDEMNTRKERGLICIPTVMKDETFYG